MDGLRVLVVAFLLCVAPIGGVVVASDTVSEPQQTTEGSDTSMSVVTVENSSEYLAPSADAIDRSGQRTAGLDVAGALEADSGELQSVYLFETLQRQYRNADTDDERRAVLERGAERLARHVEEIEAKERTAIRRFNDGDVGEYELLRTLATVHREAAETDEALEWLEAAANDVGVEDVSERATTEQVRLVPMNGPVRDQLSRTTESGLSARMYVETAGDGVVLAAVDRTGDTYLREAHDPTAKAVDVPDQYDGNPSPALDRFSELYPWSIGSFDAIDAIGPAQVRLYRFGASHPHGELATYLDSGSTEIIYETQWIDTDSVPTESRQRTDGDLRLVLDTTRAGGPLGVSVLDTVTDERVDATIELNGDSVGSTGGDRLWTVAPRGTVTVEATHGGETATFETNFE